MALDADRYRLSEADHQAIFDKRIKPALFVGVKPPIQPVAVLFGGQPGAGKSTTVDAVLREKPHGGTFVQIIGDDLRGYHPQYARLMKADDKTAAFYTDRDTGKWVEKAIDEAKAQRVNIVIEGTMRNGDTVAATMQNLRAAGYRIDACVLAVNAQFSQQGILLRYERQKSDRGTGRMTTAQSHKAALDGLPLTLERIERDKLADRVTLYRRGAETIYTNELEAGQWAKQPQARATLEAERTRPMTLQERRSYAESFERLAELMARPERQASSEEVKALDELRQQARQDLAAYVFKQESPAPERLHHRQVPTANTRLDESRRAIDAAAAQRSLIVRDAADIKRNSKGEVVAVTSHHALLRISGMVSVRYETGSLDREVRVGERVVIQHGNDKSHVHEQGKEPARDTGRNIDLG